MSPMIGYLGAVVVGAGLYLLVVGLARPPARASALRHLDERPVAEVRDDRLERPLPVRLGEALVARMSKFGRRITPSARSSALRQRLDRAGMTMPVEAFLAAKAVGGGLGLLGALLLVVLLDPTGGTTLLLVAGGLIGGAYVPDLLVHARGEERQKEITLDLPEALDLLALTVRAGMGLEQALAEVSGEVTGPLGDELDRALKEQQLGRSRREALESLKERNSSEELRSLVSALLHADRLGTPLGDTLQVQARELRRRRRALARERAGKAPVKLLFPTIFGIFPAMFVVVIGPGVIRIMDGMF